MNFQKTVLVTILMIILSPTLRAQNALSTQPRLYFSSGFVTPQFFGGTELLQAYSFRQAGQSYHQQPHGERKNVGTYGANTGFSLSIGYYVPVPWVKGLGVGLVVNSGQTGTNPSVDGYAEGYFFNFLNFGGSLQYYPMETNNLYLKAEAGMGSVFTKNRFVVDVATQDFLHHFGIGFETGGAGGYTLTPFANSSLGINLEAQYQFYSTRVEVSGIGDDQWTFGALHLMAGLQF